MNVFVTLVGAIACISAVAAWLSPKALEWIIIRLSARKEQIEAGRMAWAIEVDRLTRQSRRSLPPVPTQADRDTLSRMLADVENQMRRDGWDEKR